MAAAAPRLISAAQPVPAALPAAKAVEPPDTLRDAQVER
jgi:hypothetical protein